MDFGYRHSARLAPAALAVGLLFSLGLNAQPTGGDPIAVSYAQQFKVPLAEAKRRTAQVPEIALLEQRLQRELPDTFAGLYIEHQPTYRVVVRFTKTPKALLSRYTQDPLFVAQLAPRPLELLRGAQEELAAQLSQSGVAFESGLDLKTSQVNLFVLDTATASKRLSGLMAVADYIKLHKVPALMTPTAIVGGSRVDGATLRCTTGFNVVNATRELGVITAGHCENALTYIGSPNVTLAFKSEQNSGSLDLQWNKQSGGTPQVQSNQIKLVGGPQATMEITSVTTSANLPLGATACKNGITTNYTCGQVADKNAQAMYNGAVGTFIRVHNASNQVMNDVGDSGGPVFGTNTAYGIVHGRGGPGTPTHNDLYFVPVDHFSALGVSVLKEAFSLDRIPNVSGPHNVAFQAQVFYKGVPKFTVQRRTKIISCPSGWTCNDYNGSYTSNTASPLTFNFKCTTTGSMPTATFAWRTTLIGADGATTNAIDHTSTCTAPTVANSSNAAHGDGSPPTITIEP
ncbi:S1 family peptidase [Lysobacter sp. Hz 25]|uniref:S1 family peptidase n=1 Tax=Lysobacter sp. Hz 25 TaxID=3383698 RepID=UPI0038D51806